MRTVTEKGHTCRERYYYDYGQCKSWAQLDTNQDAPYYGTWACPIMREFICFAEGDETHIKLDTDEEFIKEINNWLNHMTESGWNPRIDPGLKEEKIKAWEKLGFKYNDTGLVERRETMSKYRVLVKVHVSHEVDAENEDDAIQQVQELSNGDFLEDGDFNYTTEIIP